MRENRTRRGLANKSQRAIRNIDCIINKERFLTHPALKQIFGTYHFSTKDYFKILKILSKFEIISFNNRGVWYISVKSVRR